MKDVSSRQLPCCLKLARLLEDASAAAAAAVDNAIEDSAPLPAASVAFFRQQLAAIDAQLTRAS